MAPRRPPPSPRVYVRKLGTAVCAQGSYNRIAFVSFYRPSIFIMKMIALGCPLHIGITCAPDARAARREACLFGTSDTVTNQSTLPTISS